MKEILSVVISEEAQINPIVNSTVDIYKETKEIYLRSKKAMGKKNIVLNNYSSSTLDNKKLLNVSKCTY